MSGTSGVSSAREASNQHAVVRRRHNPVRDVRRFQAAASSEPLSSENREQSFPILQLPEELVLLVLNDLVTALQNHDSSDTEKLDATRDIKNVRLTNKQFSRLMSDVILKNKDAIEAIGLNIDQLKSGLAERAIHRYLPSHLAINNFMVSNIEDIKHLREIGGSRAREFIFNEYCKILLPFIVAAFATLPMGRVDAAPKIMSYTVLLMISGMILTSSLFLNDRNAPKAMSLLQAAQTTLPKPVKKALWISEPG